MMVFIDLVNGEQAVIDTVHVTAIELGYYGKPGVSEPFPCFSIVTTNNREYRTTSESSARLFKSSLKLEDLLPRKEVDV